jgi:ABC-2 type transport system permease protein
VNHWRQAWLVARRELVERGRSRGFLLSLLLTTGLIVASVILPSLFLDEEPRLRLGIPVESPSGLEAALVAAAQPFGTSVEVSEHPDGAAGTEALAAEELDGLVVVPVDLAGAGELVVRESADDSLRAIVTTAVTGLRSERVLADHGVDAALLGQASEAPEVRALEPDSEADRNAFLIANIGVVIMFIGILSFGFTVLTGVVEEKQSRVVEVVLSSVRPRDVLMGKVLGIGLLGVLQLVVFLVAGVAVVSLTGRLQLPETTVPAIAQLLFWFVLGYALYATILGCLGSLATRIEEASNASTPVTLLITGSYVVSLLVVAEDPDGLLATLLTFIPFSAPMVVPLRAALDAISLPEVVASATVTLISIWVLFEVGGRIYTGAVLETAGRIRLRDAWRKAERA